MSLFTVYALLLLLLTIGKRSKEGKGDTLDIAPLVEEPHSRGAQVWLTLAGISQFYLHTHAFIHEWNESYLPFPSQPKLVLIYRSRRDGRLSWPRHHRGE